MIGFGICPMYFFNHINECDKICNKKKQSFVKTQGHNHVYQYVCLDRHCIFNLTTKLIYVDQLLLCDYLSHFTRDLLKHYRILFVKGQLPPFGMCVCLSSIAVSSVNMYMNIVCSDLMYELLSCSFRFTCLFNVFDIYKG